MQRTSAPTVETAETKPEPIQDDLAVAKITGTILADLGFEIDAHGLALIVKAARVGHSGDYLAYVRVSGFRTGGKDYVDARISIDDLGSSGKKARNPHLKQNPKESRVDFARRVAIKTAELMVANRDYESDDV